MFPLKKNKVSTSLKTLFFFKGNVVHQNFKTYDLAVNFYRHATRLTLPAHLREQLHRAASSIVLNLSEGRGRLQKNDQRRFFTIAFGSLRECQAILDIGAGASNPLVQRADVLAAHLYKLIKSIS